LAEAFGIRQVLVPANPGVGSAIGLILSDASTDLVQTRVIRAAQADPEEMQAIYDQLAESGRRQLHDQGFDDALIRIERTIDARFVHQAHDLEVVLSDGPINAQTLADAEKTFRHLYGFLFGVWPEDPVEFVDYRVRAVGRVDKADWLVEERASGPAPPFDQRSIYFGDGDRLVDTPIYRRGSLLPGHSIEGPSIIEEPTSSVIVPRKWTASIDERLNVCIRL
jgi:N-methylhydantoinase A